MEILKKRDKELDGIETFSRWGLIGLFFSFASLVLSLLSLYYWVSSAQTSSSSNINSSSSQNNFVGAQNENNSANASRIRIGDRFSSIAITSYGESLPFGIPIKNDWILYETNEKITEYSFVIDPVYQPKQVYVFVNLENGLSIINGQNINGKQVGHIEFEFSNSQTLSYPLIAGENVREWLIGAEKDIVSTTSATNTHEVFRGKHYKDKNMDGILDLITIEFSNLPNNSALTRIKVFDDSLSMLGIENPRLIIMGVVVER